MKHILFALAMLIALPTFAANDRVAWFSLPVRDIQQAGSFYAQVFNWTLTQENGQPYGTWFVKSKSNSTIGVLEQSTYSASDLTIYFQVDDITATFDKATSLGATAMQEPALAPGGPTLDTLTAVFIDPFGNHIGLTATKRKK